MIHVVCLLLLNGTLQRAEGIRIEVQGDYWLVAFKRETKLVPSNICLITGG